ncbi:retrovirus-related pol polyprotein from transposon TNT 1-94 [Tanacetum coccineum]
MMDIFESMESDIDATWKQNQILNNQLLEATLKYDIERCVLMCNDFVIDNSSDEIEKIKRESIDVIQIVLWITDSGCSKHMTGGLKLLKNFVKKFMGTIRFGNDDFATITGYGNHIHAGIDPYGSIRANEGRKYQWKKYILVIVNDYYRNTWAYFLQMKDETPQMIKKFIAQAHYEKLGIMQQFSIARMPQQNGVVKRQNHTLVEAARIMLIFSKSPEFLWDEAISTVCFTQNRSLIHTRYNKTPYELIRGRKPNVEYSHVFGSLCYQTNDREDLGKMKPKVDIGIFIGYSESSRGFSISNHFQDNDSSPEDTSIPSKEDLVNLFDPLYEEYFKKRSPEAPPIVSSSNDAVESVQEVFAKFDGNILITLYDALTFEEAESSSIAEDPSNMHEFYQVQP